MWQYDPSVGDVVWVEPAGASANVPANIASLVPSGGTVQQNMAAQLQGYGAEGGEMSFNPDGTFTISTPLADNQFLNTIVDSSGKQISQNVSSGKDTGLQDLAAFAAIPLTAGGAGGVLGGALTGGALTGTAASALGNALISGTAGAISGQDPLKAALLAAGGTYAGSLFGGPSAATESTLSDAQFVAADAAQLAAQGLGANQIEQVLKASGVNTVTAVAAADAATSGMSVDQIAKDITLGNRGLFSDMAGPNLPTSVTTDASGLQTVTTTGTAASQAPTIGLDWFADQPITKVGTAEQESSPIVNTIVTPDLNQQVTVTGRAYALRPGGIGLEAYLNNIRNFINANQGNDALIAAEAAKYGITQADIDEAMGTTKDTSNQQVTITGDKASTSTLGDILTVVDPALIGADVGPQKVADQTVTTTGTKATTNNDTANATAATAAATAADVGAQSGGGVETQDQIDRTTSSSNTLTLADIIKALTTASSLGLLGGGGGGGGGGTTPMTPNTPVPVGNADYYKAIQQYYNTYMPQTPRDVATPLQQWYEGKFGG